MPSASSQPYPWEHQDNPVSVLALASCSTAWRAQQKHAAVRAGADRLLASALAKDADFANRAQGDQGTQAIAPAPRLVELPHAASLASTGTMSSRSSSRSAPPLLSLDTGSLVTAGGRFLLGLEDVTIPPRCGWRRGVGVRRLR